MATLGYINGQYSSESYVMNLDTKRKVLDLGLNEKIWSGDYPGVLITTNNNTFMFVDDNCDITEIDYDGNVVWEYRADRTLNIGSINQSPSFVITDNGDIYAPVPYPNPSEVSSDFNYYGNICKIDRITKTLTYSTGAFFLGSAQYPSATPEMQAYYDTHSTLIASYGISGHDGSQAYNWLHILKDGNIIGFTTIYHYNTGTFQYEYETYAIIWNPWTNTFVNMVRLDGAITDVPPDIQSYNSCIVGDYLLYNNPDRYPTGGNYKAIRRLNLVTLEQTTTQDITGFIDTDYMDVVIPAQDASFNARYKTDIVFNVMVTSATASSIMFNYNVPTNTITEIGRFIGSQPTTVIPGLKGYTPQFYNTNTARKNLVRKVGTTWTLIAFSDDITNQEILVECNEAGTITSAVAISGYGQDLEFEYTDIVLDNYSTFTISGNVTDSGTPVENAVVISFNQSGEHINRGVTDASGNYTLEFLTNTPKRIMVTLPDGRSLMNNAVVPQA